MQADRFGCLGHADRQRGGQGSRHQGGPGRKLRPQGSPAVYKRPLPRKAALRSGAAMATMMTANVSCGRVSQAFLAILEPERQGLADSGMSQVTRGQGHRPKWAGYLTGAINFDSIIKKLTFRENRECLENS
jgi:hypothetical protein